MYSLSESRFTKLTEETTVPPNEHSEVSPDQKTGEHLSHFTSSPPSPCLQPTLFQDKSSPALTHRHWGPWCACAQPLGVLPWMLPPTAGVNHCTTSSQAHRADLHECILRISLFNRAIANSAFRSGIVSQGGAFSFSLAAQGHCLPNSVD